MGKENPKNLKITNLEIRKDLQQRKQAKEVKENLSNNQTKKVSKTKIRTKRGLKKANKQRVSKHPRIKSQKMIDQIFKNLCKKNKQSRKNMRKP